MAINFFLGMAFLLVVAVLCLIVFTQFQQTSYYEGPISNHFDGKRFFNAAPYHVKTHTDSLRWAFTRHKAKWPDSVSNSAVPNLSPVDASHIKVTFVNHATVLIQSSQLNFLTDPIWSSRTSPYDWIGPKRVRPPGIEFSKLPNIDVVMISHNHYDHLDLATLKQLDKKFHPLFIVPLGNKMLLTYHGIGHVIELDWWQTHAIQGAVITFLPTQHWSARALTDSFRTLWGSYGIAVAGKKIYFAGDTGYSSYFKQIHLKWGIPDLAFLPIGAYKPEWFMQQNHLNPMEAVQAHIDLAAQKSIAIHYGTFQLSDEAIDQPLIDLQQALQTLHISPGDFITLHEGQSQLFE